MKLILSIMVIVASSTMAMDVNKLLRDVKKEVAKEIQEADKVTLISKEGQRFTLTHDVAKQSETIKSMLTDGVVGKDGEIHLQNISGATLKEITELLHYLHLFKDLQNKKLLDALEEKVKVTDPILLLAAANYLDIPQIVNCAARMIARDEFKHSAFLKRSDLNKKISGLFGTSTKHIMPLIAHYYFLLSGKKLKGVSEDSYGFSVQDYLDYLPHLIKFVSHNDQPLDLGLQTPINGLECRLVLLQLRSLNGLQNVPNINNVQLLTLQQNHLQIINANDLRGLNSLIALDLMMNQLEEVHFPPLPNLQFIALQKNKLKEIPDTIALISSLKKLMLYENSLNGLVNSNIFQGKHGLSIYIDKGELSSQAITAIKAIEPSIKIFVIGWFSTIEY